MSKKAAFRLAADFSTRAAILALSHFVGEASEDADGDLLLGLVADDLARAAKSLEAGKPLPAASLRLDAERLAQDGETGSINRFLGYAAGIAVLIRLVLDAEAAA
jgi:hypothetical protein